jgi:hypothetical protein
MVTKAKPTKMWRPRGSRNVNGYNKVRRRQGDIAAQPHIMVRLATHEERAFVEEAAHSLVPRQSLGHFGAVAALERAEKILQRTRPAVLPAS